MFRQNPRPLMRRILDPSAKTLFTVAAIAFAGAIFNGYPHAGFLLKGSVGDAEIVRVAEPSEEYARYTVRLIAPGLSAAEGIIDSDRRSLPVGTIIPVLYRRDNPSRMLSVEIFVPWTRPLWLSMIGLAALGLGLRERNRVPILPPEDGKQS